MIGPDIVVPIPRDIGYSSPSAIGSGVELDEAYATLNETSSHDALAAHQLGFLLVESIGLLGDLRLLVNVHRFRGSGLHPVGEFEGFDPSR